jgi:predicted DNA-binding transcriptional regulator AlpA
MTDRPPRRSRRPEPPVWLGEAALLTAGEVCAARRCSRATLWRDVKAGRLPPPVYLAPSRPRWRLRDVIPTAAPTAEAERIPAARAAATAPATE